MVSDVNGLPIATTRSPTDTGARSIESTAIGRTGSSFTASGWTLRTARSFVSSISTSLAGYLCVSSTLTERNGRFQAQTVDLGS